MRPGATERKRGQKQPKLRRKQGRFALLAWWPFVLALFATPFAVRAASILALSGPGALQVLYPWVSLLQAHAPVALSPEQRDVVAEWILWAQFPLYGIFVSLVGRWRSLTAWMAMLLLHAAALVAAVLFAR